jgi:hypothetical protein
VVGYEGGDVLIVDLLECGPRSSAAAIEAGAIGLPSRSNQS